MQRDLSNPKWMYFKAALLLLGGFLSCGIILLEQGSWRLALLLGIAIWCFCRAYYFAFYVVQHYADPNYRFAGLFDFAKYFFRQRKPPM